MNIFNIPLIDYSTTEEMEKLLIPPSFQHLLINGIPPPKVNKLRQWQIDLISKIEWKSNKSCLCVAPTSGGKTLIAEIAVSQLLEDNPMAKIIYALPFVALANEKYFHFKKRFSRYSVKPYFQGIG